MLANHKSPCFECKKRTMTCHGSGNCKDYEEYQVMCKEASKKEKLVNLGYRE